MPELTVYPRQYVYDLRLGTRFQIGASDTACAHSDVTVNLQFRSIQGHQRRHLRIVSIGANPNDAILWFSDSLLKNHAEATAEVMITKYARPLRRTIRRLLIEG